MLFLYNVLLFITVVLCFPLILPIILTSDKRRKTFFQRLGLVPLPPELKQIGFRYPGKKNIWVHALSVGEVFSAEPLVRELKRRFRDRGVVVSVSTKTGFEIANKLFSQKADSIFFYPYDLFFSVKHIAARVDPAIVVIVETDIWPNFLFEMKKRAIPLILVNARLSERSFKGYKRAAFFTEELFRLFSNICAQSAADAKRFGSLGVPPVRITVTGNFKFDREYDFMPEQEVESLRQSLHLKRFQKVFLAGSTHKGEEEILIGAFSRLKRKVPDLIFVVAPRDPERAVSVSRLFKSAGFSTIRVKEMETSDGEPRFDVVIVDTIGVLKQLYALADVAFVGGSLVKCGGHNPLEPAAFAKPILFGPHMSDFAGVSDLLLASNGAVRVENAESLYNTAAEIIGNKKTAETMGKNAFNVFSSNKGAVEKTLKIIEKRL
ncbi:MAG: 3-deoxy-D-manno-octulosonic acid transferase [Pseudomonadota bacterium]